MAPPRRAQGLLRRGDRGRRLARARRRVLPREGPRDRQRGRAREELHRLRRRGPQHHDPARQLQDARGRALLRRLAEALRGARRRPRLQPPVLAERPPHARALGPRDVRDGQPRRGQPHQRDRLAADLPGRDQEARARDAGARPARRLSDPGGALPPARRRDPPRRGGLGPRARRRPRRRRAPPVHRGHRHRALATGSVEAVQTNRGTIKTKVVLNCTAGWSSLDLRAWRACGCRSPRTSSRPA